MKRAVISAIAMPLVSPKQGCATVPWKALQRERGNGKDRNSAIHCGSRLPRSGCTLGHLVCFVIFQVGPEPSPAAGRAPGSRKGIPIPVGRAGGLQRTVFKCNPAAGAYFDLIACASRADRLEPIRHGHLPGLERSHSRSASPPGNLAVRCSCGSVPFKQSLCHGVLFGEPPS